MPNRDNQETYYKLVQLLIAFTLSLLPTSIRENEYTLDIYTALLYLLKTPGYHHTTLIVNETPGYCSPT